MKHKVRLLDVCDVYQPKTISTKEFVENGKYTVYGANGAIGNFTDYNHEFSEVLMACRGASCGAINISKPYSWINGNAMVIHPKGSVELDLDYLKYYMMYAPKESIITGTAQPQITRQNMSNFEIIVCPIKEQRKIVSKIEELFSVIDENMKLLNNSKIELELYRQSVLDNAFKLDDYEEKKLIDVLVEKPRNGYSPKAVNYETRYKNLTLTATTSGVFKHDCYKYIDLDITEDNYLWVKHNDILIQRANTIDYVGISAIYKGENNVYTYPDLMMKCHTIPDVIPEFVLYQMQAPRARLYMRNNATGTSGNMPKINQATVMNIPIKIIQIEKQQKVVEYIEERLSTCEHILKCINNAQIQGEILRHSILKKHFEEETIE